MTRYALAASLALSFGMVTAQSNQGAAATKPRLVVGIVVDQMRNDYIYRYWERYGKGGFKRLVSEGYHFKNAHYNYIPTYTGPGHCSIYTGAIPRVHGIVGNDWFVRASGTMINCVGDNSVSPVGSDNPEERMSPINQLSSTIGDELKMSTNGRGKVYGIGIKDRSAILPAGHAADGAFWLDERSGQFISSTWYMADLPGWLKEFNAKKPAMAYLQKGWNTLYPLNTYTNSIADENSYEATQNKKEKAVFPYEYGSFLEKNKPGVIKATPYGNSLTKDLALACIRSEQLGKDGVTDLFCISFSSTDMIAHAYGPRAVEVEDVYLRLDKDLEELLNFLDKEVGKNNYTVFLTADHGGADVPNHLLDNKIPAGYIHDKKITATVRDFFKQTYGDSALLASLSNEQVFIHEKKLQELKLDKDVVEQKLTDFMEGLPGIAEAYPSRVMKNGAFPQSDYRTLLQNGYNHQRSGNVCFMYLPAWMDHGKKGTTHGAGYNYDTHVPVLFYGSGIKKGETLSYITITQIAPTVCELLMINQPNSTVAEPLNNFFK
jgi:predicted AlkP superfamily pyrophosphatase or phosphodiesterase